MRVENLFQLFNDQFGDGHENENGLEVISSPPYLSSVTISPPPPPTPILILRRSTTHSSLQISPSQQPSSSTILNSTTAYPIPTFRLTLSNSPIFPFHSQPLPRPSLTPILVLKASSSSSNYSSPMDDVPPSPIRHQDELFGDVNVNHTFNVGNTHSSVTDRFDSFSNSDSSSSPFESSTVLKLNSNLKPHNSHPLPQPLFSLDSVNFHDSREAKVVPVIVEFKFYRGILFGSRIIAPITQVLEYKSKLGKACSPGVCRKVTANSDNAPSVSAHDGMIVLLKICNSCNCCSELVGLACGVMTDLVGIEEIKICEELDSCILNFSSAFVVEDVSEFSDSDRPLNDDKNMVEVQVSVYEPLFCAKLKRAK